MKCYSNLKRKQGAVLFHKKPTQLATHFNILNLSVIIFDLTLQL